MDARQELRRAFIALGYFTRIPIPAWVGWADDDLNRSSRYFPLVGIVVGAIAALVLMVGVSIWSAGIAVGLSMLVTILVTGGFHEDGLADSADGFGGGYTPDKGLTIMQDSRIGTFGALALVMALLLKFVALLVLVEVHAGLAAVALVVALACGPAVGDGLAAVRPYRRGRQSQARGRGDRLR